MSRRYTMPESERLQVMTAFERPLWEKGLFPGGIDEVGRGALAGPVMAACVILPPMPLIEGINDSKKLPPNSRERLSESILSTALNIGFGTVGPARIDERGIVEATFEAMRRAAIEAGAEYLLVDGSHAPIALPQQAMNFGDSRSYLIAAASIAAKVKRDALMDRLDELYPGYGFAANKGYGTAQHRDAIKKLGLCPAHRRSFVKAIIAGGIG